MGIWDGKGEHRKSWILSKFADIFSRACLYIPGCPHVFVLRLVLWYDNYHSRSLSPAAAAVFRNANEYQLVTLALMLTRFFFFLCPFGQAYEDILGCLTKGEMTHARSS